MTNQSSALASLLQLDRDKAGDSLRQQLYRQLRDASVTGRLRPGHALPSTRQLAAALGIARSTVVEALDQLKFEGYHETRQGAATRIAEFRAPPAGATGMPGEPAAGAMADVASALWVNDDPPSAVTCRAFRPGLPDLGAFPAADWAACLASRARRPLAHDLSYEGYTGVPALQAEIVRHVAQARHVNADPAQVVVLPSAQAAFDVAARCCLRAGDCVWLEDPGYPGVRGVWRGHGARIVDVPVDAQGMNFEHERSRPRLIHVTPSHQYPSGVPLSLPRRFALLERARQDDAVILEDDYDSEFQYAGLPIASLQGLDRAQRVMYVGTFSKTLAPGMHVAYLIVPPRFARLAHAVASLAGMAVPVHLQLALADFMRHGFLRRHVRRMNAIYAARMRTLIDTLKAGVPPDVKIPEQGGGLQLTISWQQGPDDTRLVAMLEAQGLCALPLSRLCHAERRHGLVLGIGLVDADSIGPHACRLADLLKTQF